MAIIEDVEFEGLSVRDLADGGLQAWVHHSPAILPQVRQCWPFSEKIFSENTEMAELLRLHCYTIISIKTNNCDGISAHLV